MRFGNAYPVQLPEYGLHQPTPYPLFSMCLCYSQVVKVRTPTIVANQYRPDQTIRLPRAQA